MSHQDRGAGAAGFTQDFWSENYSHPETMDGVFNAHAHARYARAAFDVIGEEIASIVDLGFGMGHLFTAVLEVFDPYKALGIEPSPVGFAALAGRPLGPRPDKVRLEQIDLASWSLRPDTSKDRYDLAICTSVLQYLTDDELEILLPVVSRRAKYLYLTVPTEREREDQARHEAYVDTWAYVRTRQEWRTWLAPHFISVGGRLLESRHSPSRDRSLFTDDLFRDDWLVDP